MQIFNKRASFDYELTGESYEAGVVLKGIEAKAFRDNRVSISQSYVKIIDGEVYLINANIPAENIKGYNPTRMRKLLLHKEEVLAIITKTSQKKLQIVPTKMYNRKRRIKLEIALGKSKKKFEKKESIKKKDIQREVEKDLKANY